jgi:hypothetical protein
LSWIVIPRQKSNPGASNNRRFIAAARQRFCHTCETPGGKVSVTQSASRDSFGDSNFATGQCGNNAWLGENFSPPQHCKNNTRARAAGAFNTAVPIPCSAC